jgi:hypothetical protein
LKDKNLSLEEEKMKKLITICAVVAIAMLCLGTISTAQAYEFELGRTTYGDINHGYISGESGTTEYFTYSQDLSGPPEYEPSAFNFALSNDPHLWDYLYAGPYTAYNTHHLYQSSLNQFTINISMNQANVAAWDRDSNDGPSSNVLGCAWSISSPYYNSPLRGASVTNFVLNGSEFSGTLVSDGGIHWPHSPDTADLTLYDYQDTFRFVGNMSDGSLIVYANTVPSATIQTYSIVDYPVSQIDTVTGLTDHISGTITADPTTGVIYSASFTITGATSYTVASAAIDPYFVHITPTQITLTQTNPSNPLGYGNLRLSGSTGVSGANNSAVVQWYVPGDPWVVGSYPYPSYMGTVGSKGSGPLFAGGLGNSPWVVATATNYCPEPLAGDLNGDCRVNFKDLAILVNQWLQPSGSPSADIAPPPSGDGIVNFLDFEIMAENWLKCNLQPQSSCQ